MIYSDFASVYDLLTEDIDYRARTDYIFHICQKHGHKPVSMLDAACGTGSFSILFAKAGLNVAAVDASEEMLCMAENKSSKEDLNIVFIRQKLQNLSLYNKVDTAVCLSDSLNHIVNEKELFMVFENIHQILLENGLFIFDVNTEYKHAEVLSNNTFVIEKEDVFCVWQNEKKGSKTEITLDFFINRNGRYERGSEHFFERAYSNKKIEKLLKNAGFSLLAVYDDLNFLPPAENSERIFYVAVKI